MRKLLLVIGVASIGLLLAGCVPPAPTGTATPRPSSTPIFASDEEALAAAETAYAAYLKLADQIFVEGGVNPERLSAVATGSFLSTSVEGYQDAESRGWQSTGGTVFRGMTLQSYDRVGDKAVVIVYVCEDVSMVNVVDGAGLSVVSPNRPNTTLFQSTFDLDPERKDLLLAGREAWSNDPC